MNSVNWCCSKCLTNLDINNHEILNNDGHRLNTLFSSSYRILIYVYQGCKTCYERILIWTNQKSDDDNIYIIPKNDSSIVIFSASNYKKFNEPSKYFLIDGTRHRKNIIKKIKKNQIEIGSIFIVRDIPSFDHIKEVLEKEYIIEDITINEDFDYRFHFCPTYLVKEPITLIKVALK